MTEDAVLLRVEHLAFKRRCRGQAEVLRPRRTDRDVLGEFVRGRCPADAVGLRERRRCQKEQQKRNDPYARPLLTLPSLAIRHGMMVLFVPRHPESR